MSVLLAKRRRLGIPRHDGSVSTIDAGQWARSASRTVLCCPGCAGLYDIDEVNASGEVEEEFICQSPACDVAAQLTLSGWRAPAFDVSDVEVRRG